MTAELWRRIITAKELTIERGNTEFRCRLWGDETDAELIADADDLVRAANCPCRELLAACKALVESIEKDVEINGTTTTRSQDKAILLASKAIAKANGEAP